ncbi:MAG: phosphomethylpyrimidine synthase ThiC [Succinivibrio sp.]|nr:phosphomethylpyrimidine synthase ThiC [Succinivibrio sp.]
MSSASTSTNQFPAFKQQKQRVLKGSLQVPFDELTLSNGTKLLIYTTEGPKTSPLPRRALEWSEHYQDGDACKVRRTQLDYAKAGIITRQMEYVAQRESYVSSNPAFTPEDVCQNIAQGRAVIPCNINHPEVEPMVIGARFACKVNANIGASSVSSDYEQELSKLAMSLKFGADTVMDLSVGISDLMGLRSAILRASPVPIGTVPVYEALDRAEGKVENLTWEVFRQTVIDQARQGVDYFTIHAGLLQSLLPAAAARQMGIVSRGGSVMAARMVRCDEENLAFTHFDELLEICHDYDVALSLGDGLRPGCIADACDKAQYGELEAIGKLARRCYAASVQCFIEGPGHVPLHKVEENQRLEEQLCSYAPFYTLGPLVTDIAPGYDHITSAIGGAQIAAYGTAMLCYVTPSEHLALPDPEDVKTGLITYKLAAHAADLAKGLPGAELRDLEMAKARDEFRWYDQFALSLDPEHAYQVWAAKMPENCGHEPSFCSMCGPRFCPIRLNRKLREVYGKR